MTYTDIVTLNDVLPIQEIHGFVGMDMRSDELKVFKMLVTPELAEYFISLSEGNRKSIKSRVKEIAYDITQNDWQFDTAVVQFTTDGKNANGEHRFNAVIESNTAVYMVIEVGVSKAAKRKIDISRVRTFCNVLEMEGVPNPSIVAATTKLLYHWENGKPLNQSRVPDTKQNEIYDKYSPRMNHIADAIMALPYDLALHHCSFVFLEVIMPATHSRIYKKFIGELSDGYSNTRSADSPTRTLLNFLLHTATQNRITPTERLFFVVSAWNAFAYNKPLSEKWVKDTLLSHRGKADKLGNKIRTPLKFPGIAGIDTITFDDYIKQKHSVKK